MMTEARTRLLFRISPRSPLVLGNRSGTGNFQESEDEIPGSVLRGMVAEKLLEACLTQNGLDNHADCPDPDTCPFWQLFGSEEPYFRTAYPGGITGPVWPIPLTSRTCKTHGGWPTGQEKAGHGVFDVLLAEFAYGLVTDPSYPFRAELQPELGETWSSLWEPSYFQPHTRCPKCGSSLKPVTQHSLSYYAWAGEPQAARVMRKRRMVHVGINRARSVAEDALLFTQESLQAERTDHFFYTEVSVPTAKAAALQAVLSGTFYIGRGRSKGQGEIVVEAYASDTFPSLERRVKDFQLAAADLLNTYRQDARVHTEWPGTLFSLTLRTPTILEAGADTANPNSALFGLPAEIRLLQSWVKTELAGGWNSAVGLPRRTQQAISAGGVFLFFAPESLAEADLMAALAAAEQNGIGDQRERGYGQVTACAPFHTMQVIEPNQ